MTMNLEGLVACMCLLACFIAGKAARNRSAAFHTIASLCHQKRGLQLGRTLKDGAYVNLDLWF